MSEGWQIGDLALCVGSDIPSARYVTGVGHPVVGLIYRVNFVHPPLEYAPEQGVGLGLEGFELLYCSPGFRKIKHDVAPCDAEFSAMMPPLKADA